MSIQSISAFDVFVFPSGHRCYRIHCNSSAPLEAQVYPVGHPLYKTEVLEMRAQAKHWHDDHRMTEAETEAMLRRHKHMVDFDVCYSEPVARSGRQGAVKQASYLQGQGTGRLVHKLGE